MLNSFQSYRAVFQQALLARASYADLNGVDFSNVELLQSRLAVVMPSAAATYVATTFGVVHHQPNTLVSGYSGTLFRARIVDGADSTGGFTFALRGTEPSDPARDLFITDTFGILLGGIATDQGADMLEHWDAMLSESGPLESAIRQDLAASRVSVSGHSLGRRTVLEYLLSPVQRVASEAGMER